MRDKPVQRNIRVLHSLKCCYVQLQSTHIKVLSSIINALKLKSVFAHSTTLQYIQNMMHAICLSIRFSIVRFIHQVRGYTKIVCAKWYRKFSAAFVLILIFFWCIPMFYLQAITVACLYLHHKYLHDSNHVSLLATVTFVGYTIILLILLIGKWLFILWIFLIDCCWLFRCLHISVLRNFRLWKIVLHYHFSYIKVNRSTQFFFSFGLAHMRKAANRWCHQHNLSDIAYAIWIALNFFPSSFNCTNKWKICAEPCVAHLYVHYSMRMFEVPHEYDRSAM